MEYTTHVPECLVKPRFRFSSSGSLSKQDDVKRDASWTVHTDWNERHQRKSVFMTLKDYDTFFFIYFISYKLHEKMVKIYFIFLNHHSFVWVFFVLSCRCLILKMHKTRYECISYSARFWISKLILLLWRFFLNMWKETNMFLKLTLIIVICQKKHNVHIMLVEICPVEIRDEIYTGKNWDIATT